MTEQRIAELERIGMAQDIYDDVWAKGYARVKAHFEEHGNLNVLVRFMTKDG